MVDRVGGEPTVEKEQYEGAGGDLDLWWFGRRAALAVVLVVAAAVTLVLFWKAYTFLLVIFASIMWALLLSGLAHLVRRWGPLSRLPYSPTVMGICRGADRARGADRNMGRPADRGSRWPDRGHLAPGARATPQPSPTAQRRGVAAPSRCLQRRYWLRTPSVSASQVLWGFFPARLGCWPT